MMITVNPKDIPMNKMHGYLLGAITPRPIALASTVDHEGNVNLSPFSFFNVFGFNPPIVIFSPSRRGRDNTTKHTYENLRQIAEVVIHIVNYKMVQQTSLSSTEYAKGINEFTKAGFTELPSTLIKPPRVAEAPIAMECKVLQIIQTGSEGGAGNLVICEVILMHIQDHVLDDQGRIDPYKLDAVARLGGDYYSRVQGDSIFTVPKPLNTLGIGVDQLPSSIRLSTVFTGNDLGLLANVEAVPASQSEKQIEGHEAIKNAWQQGEVEVHRLAQQFLRKGDLDLAWQTLLYKQKRPE